MAESQELADQQLCQLQVLLQQCFQHVPYYHQLLAEAGYPVRPFGPLSDFRRLPSGSKLASGHAPPPQTHCSPELLDHIRDSRSFHRMVWRKILDIHATSIDNDGQDEGSQRFFKTVQNWYPAEIRRRGWGVTTLDC